MLYLGRFLFKSEQFRVHLGFATGIGIAPLQVGIISVESIPIRPDEAVGVIRFPVVLPLLLFAREA